MPTLITNPTAGNAVPVDSFLVVEGGFGGTTAAENLQNVGGIPAASKGKASGPIPLDAQVAIPAEFLSALNPNELSIVGPDTLQCNQYGNFYISNFDSYSTYPLTANGGTVSISNGMISYRAPATPGPCGFTMGARQVNVTAVNGAIKKPSIVSPVAGTVPDNGMLMVTGSLFDAADTGPDFETFVSADLEISDTLSFDSDNNASLVRAIYGGTATSFLVDNFVLGNGKYIRIRYNGTRESSDWSDVVHITPAVSYINPPVISHVVTSDSSDSFRDKLALSLSWPAMTFVGQNQTFNSVDIEYSNSPAFDDGQHAESAFGMDTAQTGYLMKIPYNKQIYIRARFNSTTTSSAWSDTLSFVSSADPRTVNAPLAPSNAVSTIDPSLKHLFTVTATPVCNGFTDTISQVDWKVTTDAAGNNVVSSETVAAAQGQPSTHLTQALQFSTEYYIHVTFITTRKTSATYSEKFTTQADNRAIVTPTVQSVTATPLSAVISLSAFATSPAGFSDTHVSTQWEIATDAGFTNIVENSGLSTTAKVQYTPTMNLVTGTNYYLRATYHGAKKVSAPLIHTLNVARPPITLTVSTPNPTSTDLRPVVSTSPFVANVPGDVHTATNWQIATDASFTNIVASSYGNTVNKLNWSPSVSLAYNTTYYARAQFISTVGNSNYSPAISFKTMVDNRAISAPSLSVVDTYDSGIGGVSVVYANGFSSNFGDTQATVIWEQSANNGGEIGYVSAGSGNGPITLYRNTLSIYVRARFIGSSGVSSGWSAPIYLWPNEPYGGS